MGPYSTGRYLTLFKVWLVSGLSGMCPCRYFFCKWFTESHTFTVNFISSKLLEVLFANLLKFIVWYSVSYLQSCTVVLRTFSLCIWNWYLLYINGVNPTSLGWTHSLCSKLFNLNLCHLLHTGYCMRFLLALNPIILGMQATFAGVWRYCSGGWNIVDILSSLVRMQHACCQLSATFMAIR